MAQRQPIDAPAGAVAEGLWQGIPTALKRVGAEYVRELAFMSRRRIEAWSCRKLRILFSKRDDWEPNLRRDFRYTGHELIFGSLAEEDLPKYDLIVPLSVADTLYLHSVRERIAHSPIPIPSPECIRICDDKLLFHRTLVQGGFADFLPQTGTNLPYPYILKKRIDEWGSNSHIITDPEQERLYGPQLTDPQYFCQEVVAGTHEYATHVLFSRGSIRCSVNVEYVFDRELFIKGRQDRHRSCQRTGPSPYLPLFASILNRIGFEGLCCFNYKVAGDKPMIFEVNPRFGASLSGNFLVFVTALIRDFPAAG